MAQVSGRLKSAEDLAASGGGVTCGWRVGQVVWVKLGRYPWWPAVVSCEPRAAAWARWLAEPPNKRAGGGGGGGRVAQIFVVFFGDNTHHWVPANKGVVEPFAADTVEGFVKDPQIPYTALF